jgi:hypothetical protein
MQKTGRTTAELLQELEEDRLKDIDFERALYEQAMDGEITVEQALERLWDHLMDDHVGNLGQAQNMSEPKGDIHE